jgi:REP element-mobilizing transposase RayT
MNVEAHSRNLRKHRVTDVPATFFITKSLQPEKPALDHLSRQVIVSAFEFAAKRERIYLRAFVVMPDHWHGLFALIAPWTLPRFMHGMMSFIAARTERAVRDNGIRWQDSYYDTRVRTAKQFAYIQHYIEQNPVAKGLAERPENWEASSANRPDLITDPWPWFFE